MKDLSDNNSFLSEDFPKEYCGIVGIYGEEDAAAKAYLGLYALQHRGQESAGIASSDGSEIKYHKGMGLVRSVFLNPAVFEKLTGSMAIGHNRYSTRGGSFIANAQPLVIRYKDGQIALAHNGNIVNATELRAELENSGSIFQTTSDSEIVLHLVAKSSKETIEEKIEDALGGLKGAYCFVFLTPEKLIAVRDPHGFRPLSLASTASGGWMIASETCAFDIADASYMRTLEPGEMVVIDSQGLKTKIIGGPCRRSSCIFEFIYFSRPDSWIFGEKVDKIRRRLGKQLATEAPAEADIVIAVPDSANTAALGYAHASGIRFEIGLIRNHYIGRTFISPQQKARQSGIKVKFNPVTGVLKDRRVIVVDDSIVRGTTMKKLVNLIRSGGASEVHVRISSPPVKFPCFYGIDISEKEELVGSGMSVSEIRDFIGADSLSYLSVEGMLMAVERQTDFCAACFTGRYPTDVPACYKKIAFNGCGALEP